MPMPSPHTLALDALAAGVRHTIQLLDAQRNEYPAYSDLVTRRVVNFAAGCSCTDGACAWCRMYPTGPMPYSWCAPEHWLAPSDNWDYESARE